MSDFSKLRLFLACMRHILYGMGMTAGQKNVFRAYNITNPWATEFSYVLEHPQWMFEDVLMKPLSAKDVPWEVAKTLLGQEAANKGTILYNTAIIQDYSRALAFIDTLNKISLSCEKFVAITTHGNAKWALQYLEPTTEITVLRMNGRMEYCVLLPANKYGVILEPLRTTFDLQSVLESFNPIVKPA